MNGTVFIIPMVVVALGLAARVISRAINGRLENRYAAFLMERSGTSGAEIDREFRLRTSAARLRRTASMATTKAPARAEQIIRDLARAEGLKMAATDKSAAKQFLQWAEGAEISEILYPAAMKAVWKHARGAAQRSVAVKEDSDLRRDIEAALKVSG